MAKKTLEHLEAEIGEAIKKKIADINSGKLNNERLYTYICVLIMSQEYWELIDHKREKLEEIIRQAILGLSSLKDKALIQTKAVSPIPYIELECQPPTPVKNAQPRVTLNRNGKVSQKPPYFEED